MAVPISLMKGSVLGAPEKNGSVCKTCSMSPGNPSESAAKEPLRERLAGPRGTSNVGEVDTAVVGDPNKFVPECCFEKDAFKLIFPGISPDRSFVAVVGDSSVLSDLRLEELFDGISNDRGIYIYLEK